jgi:hypothetical protein
MIPPNPHPPNDGIDNINALTCGRMQLIHNTANVDQLIELCLVSNCQARGVMIIGSACLFKMPMKPL